MKGMNIYIKLNKKYPLQKQLMKTKIKYEEKENCEKKRRKKIIS